MTMPTVVRRPYPSHKAGLAAIPLYSAVVVPVVALGYTYWPAFLLLLPCWFGLDFLVSRFLIWQVNSLQRPIWKALLAIALAGLAIDILVAGLIYAFYTLSS
jgi:hypothetical protein